MRSLTILSAFLLFVSTVLFSCTKIEYTTLGGDLVPDVDNVNTFDTTLDVITENLPQNDDTTKLYYYDQLAVGQIKNDPLFGPTTEAAIYFEIKPSAFSTTNTARNFIDSSFSAIVNSYDSTVLSLKFDGGYGDSLQAIRFDVYPIMLSDTLIRLQDTIYRLNKSFQTLPSIGSKTISLRSIANDSVSVYRSTILSYKKTGELRIPLTNNSFWVDLLKDSVALSDDGAYRKKFAGFAIKAVPVSSIGSLAYFSISDTATKLQFYYRRKNAGVIDTTNTNFYFNPNNSGYANNVNWNRGVGSELARYLTAGADSFIYVKTNPGTQVRIRIPGLEGVSNRIIHRAELKTYVIPGDVMLDSILSPPPVMYLERYDTAVANAFLPIPRDLSPNELYGNCFPSTNGINYGYFGGYPRYEQMNNSNVKFYSFNVSQYVQQIVTHQLLNSPLRLTANMNAQYINCNSGAPFRATSNIISYGRAKLGGGGLKGTFAPYKMRLRIIYSKI